MRRGPAAMLLWACAGPAEVPTPPPEPAPAPLQAAAPQAPDPTLRVAERVVHSPAAVPTFGELARVRAVLEGVVLDHGRDPANPWAIGHAMVALGPDLELTNGQPAVDWLFTEYAQVVSVGDTELVAFPRSRGKIRIEPHTDLLLKALTQTGVPPTRAVTVEGRPFTVGHLYRHSVHRAWVDGARTGFQSWNDTPWALQSIAAWGPEDLAWEAQGGHPMTMDGFTTAVVGKLHDETAFMRDAMARGLQVQKRKQGIFAYTCGGQHLLQGAAYAVARGYGTDEDRARVADQVPVLFWRVDLELEAVDQALQQHPDYGVLLMAQRLKFLGHFVESAHSLAAMGLYTPDATQQKTLDRVVTELVVTVSLLESNQLFAQLPKLRASSEQTYLDYIGDSAHALHGIDLMTGVAAVRL